MSWCFSRVPHPKTCSNEEPLHEGLYPPSPAPLSVLVDEDVTDLFWSYPAASLQAGLLLGHQDHGFCLVTGESYTFFAQTYQARGSSRQPWKPKFRPQGNMCKHGYPWAVESVGIKSGGESWSWCSGLQVLKATHSCRSGAWPSLLQDHTKVLWEDWQNLNWRIK